MCGAPNGCVISIPAIHWDYIIPIGTDPCPTVPNHQIQIHSIYHQLWNMSPSHGYITTHLVGQVQLIQYMTNQSIVEFSFQVHLR
jgi:hypothetical protein